MTPEEFAVSLYNQIVVEHSMLYQEELNKPLAEIKTARFKELAKCFQNMNSEAKEALACVLAIASINAVSEVLGILDGTTSLSNARGNFQLLDTDANAKISGCLQDYFLEEVEIKNILNDS